MAKKRKCRLTTEELEIHNKAVSLRKMSDRQLVEAFNQANATDMGAAATTVGEKTPQTNEVRKDTGDIEKLLDGLTNGECKGIKGGLAYKIREYAKEKGLIT